MRLAVISDIHGNALALEAVLADITERSVDQTINLGDCVTGPLWPEETFAMLNALAIPMVRGNHDRMIAEFPRDQLSPAGRFAYDTLNSEQRATLGALPARLGLPDGMLAVHGTPDDDSTYLMEEVVDGRLAPARRETLAARLGSYASAPVILCGHSHRQAAIVGPGGCLVVNPGSVGCPVFADSPAAPGLEHRSPHARYAILQKVRNRWNVEMIALDYDWHSASRRAAEIGGPAWAEAIATGTVGQKREHA